MAKKNKKTIIGIYQTKKNVTLKCNGILIATFYNANLLYHPMDCSLNIIKDKKVVCSWFDEETDQQEFWEKNNFQLDTNLDI